VNVLPLSKTVSELPDFACPACSSSQFHRNQLKKQVIFLQLSAH